MSKVTFLENPAYLQFVHQLLELHSLMAQGQSETPQADALREEMLQPWRALSTAEIERTDGLSGDLYMLTGEEIVEQVEPRERSQDRLGPRLRTAWENRDWDKVLMLLRIGPDFLTPGQVAYLRGRCWAELGHPEIALLFFDHAARLNPQNINYRVMTLEPLLQLGQLEEARQRAHTLGVDAEAHLVQLV